MKAMWEIPRIAVEAFAPNDYVAVCWKVGCGAGSKGTALPEGDYSKEKLWGAYAGYESVFTGYDDRGHAVYKNQVTVNDTLYTVEMNHSGSCSQDSRNNIQSTGNTLADLSI